MSNTEIRAPGEKEDYSSESLYDHIKPNEIGSRVPTNHYDNSSSISSTLPSSRRRVSTAHIQPVYNINGTLAFDQFVSVCSDFLGSPTINETVTQFAENILAILSSPTTLEASEVKRRIEQILPPLDKTHSYKHYRGTKITDKDCTELCSLADRIVNPQPSTNDIEQKQNSYNSRVGGEVHYIRHQQIGYSTMETLPKRLPNFVEPNVELGDTTNEVYDADITPYDSEIDEPIRMK